MPRKQDKNVDRDNNIPLTLQDGGPLPQLIAFDLDYTLWPFWVDTHVYPPIKASGQYNLVEDASGDEWHFYPHVPEILHALREKGVKVAAASRTHAPDLARRMLKLLELDPAHVGGEEGKTGYDYFDTFEIFPGSKTTHFRNIHKNTGIDYSEMLFFDDEARNRNVQKELGVLMILVPKGVSMDSFDKGVREWRKRRGHERHGVVSAGAVELG